MKTTTNTTTSTELTTTEQLAALITNKDKHFIFHKLYYYYNRFHDDLNDLTNEISVNGSEDYRFYVIYDNTLDFWNDMFTTPAQAIKAVGSHYDLKDKYIAEGCDGKYYSLNDLDDVWVDEDVYMIIQAVIADLKRETEEETEENIKYLDLSQEVQELMLTALTSNAWYEG